MKTSLFIILVTTAVAATSTGYTATGRVSQRGVTPAATETGGVWSANVPTAARNTGASQGHTTDLAINNLN